MEDQVVQRRVAVVAEGVEQISHREAGDVDAERLVQPQRRALHEAQDDAEGHDAGEHCGRHPRGQTPRADRLGDHFVPTGIPLDGAVDHGAHEAAMLATRSGPLAIRRPPTGPPIGGRNVRVASHEWRPGGRPFGRVARSRPHR